MDYFVAPYNYNERLTCPVQQLTRKRDLYFQISNLDMARSFSSFKIITTTHHLTSSSPFSLTLTKSHSGAGGDVLLIFDGGAYYYCLHRIDCVFT